MKRPLAGLILTLSVVACGSTGPASGASSSTPSPTAKATLAPTATPTVSAGMVHVVLSGDATLDTTAVPDPSGCGLNSTGAWVMGVTDAPLLSVGISPYTGPGTYPVSYSDPSNHTNVLLPNLPAGNGRSVAAIDGTITVGQGGKHAVVTVTGGFTVPPDFAKTSGKVTIAIDITCP